MPEMHNELLMNIPDEYLETLADMYKEHGQIPYASSFITNGMKIRRKGKFLIRFMSPGCSWRDDGTFFALMEFPQSYQLAVFTLDKTCGNVYEGLMKTKRLHFERPLGFSAVHNSVYPTVLKVIEDKKLKVKEDHSYYIFSISNEEARKFQIDCPEDIELRKLDETHAGLANSQWQNSFPDSEEFLSCLIEMNGGYGLFLKSNDELVSWIIRTGLGQLGILQTVEGHKRKGYASILTKMLAKKIAQEDEAPSTTIAVDNVAPQKMFLKLGFENKGVCHYIDLEKVN